MKPLPIAWKRPVKEGETCQRCGSTQQNVVSAMPTLEIPEDPIVNAACSRLIEPRGPAHNGGIEANGEHA